MRIFVCLLVGQTIKQLIIQSFLLFILAEMAYICHIYWFHENVNTQCFVVQWVKCHHSLFGSLLSSLSLPHSPATGLDCNGKFQSQCMTQKKHISHFGAKTQSGISAVGNGKVNEEEEGWKPRERKIEIPPENVKSAWYFSTKALFFGLLGYTFFTKSFF